MNLCYKFHVAQGIMLSVSFITDLCMATLSDGHPMMALCVQVNDVRKAFLLLKYENY
jgi:hypothetical protein